MKQKSKKTIRRIKDLVGDRSLGGLKFKHPETGEICYWRSQWAYPGGQAGVWYSKEPQATQVFTIFLKDLEEALEFELAD